MGSRGLAVRDMMASADEADAMGPSQGQSCGQEFLGLNPAANHRQMVGGPSKSHSILFSGILDM